MTDDLEHEPAPRGGVSRRQALLGLGAGAVAAIGGGVYFAAPRRYLREMLARTLPGVRLDPEGVALFEEEMFSVRLTKPKDKILSWGLGPASWVDPLAPQKVRQLREDFDRKALTFFFNGSDFFAYENPREEVIGYYGALDMCATNPFAVFEDAEEPVVVSAIMG